MAEITVLGGYLVSSAAVAPRRDWGLHICDGVIAEVGPNHTLPGYRTGAGGVRVIDARDQIVIPGFVNTHMHMYGLLSHGITVPVAPSGFYAFLEEFWWPYVEDRLDHSLIRAVAALACAEMIRSGITSFSDILEAPNAVPGALEVESEVVEASGLRAILSFEATERKGPENGQLGLQENEAFIRRHRRPGRASGDDVPSVLGMMCVHTTFTCSPRFLSQAREKASELGSGIQLHVSESSYEPRWCRENYGKAPVELYEEMGFLGEDLLASQCVQLTEAEMDLLAGRGVRVSHMPLSNCEVGGGIAPVPDLLARGITVGLGTDGYINNFFEVMRGAFLIHKAHRQDPSVMPARLVFDLATARGAQALGFTDAGTLEVGKSADVVMVKGDLPTPVNEDNLFDQLVLYRNHQDVQTVIARGRVLMEEGRLLTLDEERVRARAREAAATLWRGE
ncbi:MAG TPA: amidohydrolase family protein [Firmicutes bacterium]|nr:amidohydrolase family protein [Bacillota bacterium]